MSAEDVTREHRYYRQILYPQELTSPESIAADRKARVEDQEGVYDPGNDHSDNPTIFRENPAHQNVFHRQ